MDNRNSRTKKSITDKIDAAVQWSNKTGIPTWVGSWTPGNDNKGDTYSIAEQKVFGEFMACQLNKNHIPFALNSDTKFYDRITNKWLTTPSIKHPNWSVEVLDAILRPTLDPQTCAAASTL